MTAPDLVKVASSSDTEPDGWKGYRKSIGAFAGVVLALVTNAWADGTITAAEWRTIALGAVAAAIPAFILPNQFKELTVAVPPTPAVNVDPEVIDDEPGKHAVDNPDRLAGG